MILACSGLKQFQEKKKKDYIVPFIGERAVKLKHICNYSFLKAVLDSHF